MNRLEQIGACFIIGVLLAIVATMPEYRSFAFVGAAGWYNAVRYGRRCANVP